MTFHSRKALSGTSLIELMVSSVLVLLLMGEVWMMLSAGNGFYLRVKGQTETQRSALIALRWLSKDLAEGAPLSFRHYDPANPTVTTTRDGIVFGSPKDLDEKIRYNDDSQIVWTSMTCYYIEPETSILYRTKVLLDAPDIVAPRVLDVFHHVDVLAANPLRRSIAHNVIKIESTLGPSNVKITLKCRDEKLGYGLTVSTRLEMKNR